MTVKSTVMRGVTRIALARPAVGWLGKPRQQGVDRELDPQVAAVLELERRLRYPALDSMAPPEARRFAAGMSVLDLPRVTMAGVVDRRIAAVPVRTYTPHGASGHEIVYFHGGGGVIGSIASSDRVARWLAANTGCAVTSVDYRLGPEHKHPAAIDDAVAVWNGLRSRISGRAVVAGESFGGFLAAHVARAAAQRPDLQVLIYPMTDLTLGLPSIDRHAEGYLLTRSMMQWFCRHYLHDTDDRRASSPLYWQNLDGAAPAIVITAGYDPLVDEGDAFAAALQAAGTGVAHRRYPALIHGFLGIAGAVRAARVAFDELCREIRDRVTA